MQWTTSFITRMAWKNRDASLLNQRRAGRSWTKHHKLMMDGRDCILKLQRPSSFSHGAAKESLATAANEGYSGLLSSVTRRPMWPASRHYAVDPMSGAAASLNPEEKSRILGQASCMWDRMGNPEILDRACWRARPRLPSVYVATGIY